MHTSRRRLAYALIPLASGFDSREWEGDWPVDWTQPPLPEGAKQRHTGEPTASSPLAPVGVHGCYQKCLDEVENSLSSAASSSPQAPPEGRRRQCMHTSNMPTPVYPTAVTSPYSSPINLASKSSLNFHSMVVKSAATPPPVYHVERLPCSLYISAIHPALISSAETPSPPTS